MNKKNQLRADLDKISKVITIFIQSFEFCHYLNYPKDHDTLDRKHLDYITKSGFFSFVRYALWRVTIVEIHKITSTNKNTDKNNIHNLLNKLKNNGPYRSLKIEESKIAEWENELKNQNESIEQVKNLRFKIYAHTDNDYENVIKNSELTLKSTQELIDVIVKVVFDIYLNVLDIHFVFRPIHDKRIIEKIIGDLIAKQEIDRNELMERFLGKSTKENNG